MSGGSYNYLYKKDAEDLFNLAGPTLDEMCKRLAELGFIDAAHAAETLRLNVRRAGVRINAELEELRDVFKAVEWHDSGDLNLEEMVERVERWRQRASLRVDLDARFVDIVRTARDKYDKARNPFLESADHEAFLDMALGDVILALEEMIKDVAALEEN
jgi:hypothetical protein